jgi:hypothetical protein
VFQAIDVSAWKAVAGEISVPAMSGGEVRLCYVGREELRDEAGRMVWQLKLRRLEEEGHRIIDHHLIETWIQTRPPGHGLSTKQHDEGRRPVSEHPTPETGSAAFDPSQYVRDVRAQAHREVKYRLM